MLRLSAWFVVSFVTLSFVASGLMVLLAATHTITYTTAQDNLIQTKLIPAFNRNKCAAYGKPPTCQSADLVAAGCKVQDMCDVLGLNQASNACIQTDDMKTNSCTIFTLDAPGQDAVMREALNNSYATTYGLSESQGSQDFKTAFETSSDAAKSNSCTAIGLPPNCPGP